MTVNSAFQYLADFIWTHGEIGESEGILIPSRFDREDNKMFSATSDVLSEKYKATHYDRKWVEKGKTVEIRLWSCMGGNGFGATTEGMTLVHKELVEVK
jgi:hypothetical protein